MGAQPLNSAQQKAMDDALAMAVGASDLDMMKNAVEGGANANLLLFYGILNKQLEWVKAAVDRGADVRTSVSGLSYGDILDQKTAYPAAVWLARNFHPDVGDYLLTQGVDIDAPSPEGNTALLVAIQLRDAQVIQYLTKHGADPLHVCACQKFPLKLLQDDTDGFTSSKKMELVKAMMENMKQRRTTAAAPGTPANDTRSVTTTEDIEVSKPLELKKKPQVGFEL